MSKTIILIDGAYFVQRFKEINKKTVPHRHNNKKTVVIKPNPTIKDIRKLIVDIQKKMESKSGSLSDSLLRVMYYDCLPHDREETDPNGKVYKFGETTQYSDQNSLLNAIKHESQFALRLGRVSFNGWQFNLIDNKPKYSPIFKQKSVDMKIGLDIAWTASRKTADKIVLVAGDSDFVAPMKLARREGILVYLYPVGASYIKAELKEHADFILE